MTTFTYSADEYRNPFRTREAAQKKLEAVMQSGKDAEKWLRENGHTPRESKLEIVSVPGGYKVVETYD